MPKADHLKLILFDIGGVLIEYKDVFKTVSKEQSFPLELMDKTFDKYDFDITTGKITPQELYKACIRENSIKADAEYNFLNSWLRDYISINTTFNLLPALKHKYKVGLFSNIYKGMIPEMISMGLLPNIVYDFSFLSCEMGMQKPFQETYDFVTHQSGLKPMEILFVDDKEENLKSAANLSWNTFLFQRNDPEKSVIKLKGMLL